MDSNILAPVNSKAVQNNLASRIQRVQPFHVMELLARAQELQAQGKDIIHLEVGEPDFKTPQPILDAGMASLQKGELFYTPSFGIPQLRQMIAEAYYGQRFDLNIEPRNIMITNGASGALFLALASVLNPGDGLLLSDPGYPCNSNFAHVLSAKVNRVAVDDSSQYQLTAELIEKNWTADTKVVLLASPSNPTGTVVAQEEIEKIHALVKAKGGILIVDEIYQGLIYEQEPTTALQVSRDLIVINSFSKYFQMTGWRLGWCVLPDGLLKAMDVLSQNIYLSPSTPAQYAALAAFQPETTKILEQRRAIFQQRRDFLLPTLKQLGFGIAVKPQGAFYLYADCSRFTQDSMQFCHQLLEEIGVAITPGIDFGEYRAEQYVRFAYTRDLEILQKAVSRLKEYL